MARPRFVPPLVFASTLAGVVPACGGEADSDVGQSGGEAGAGGSGHVIVLAVAGFTGTAGRNAGGQIIVLAIAGFTGSGGAGAGGTPPLDAGRDSGPPDASDAASGDGAPPDGAPEDGASEDAAPDAPIIILAMAGFAGPRPR